MKKKKETWKPFKLKEPVVASKFPDEISLPAPHLYDNDMVCDDCGKKASEHGLVFTDERKTQSILVCPGYLIVKRILMTECKEPDGCSFFTKEILLAIMSNDEFTSNFEPAAWTAETLRECRYDGLVNDGECACINDKLYECGLDPEDCACKPGHLRPILLPENRKDTKNDDCFVIGGRSCKMES